MNVNCHIQRRAKKGNALHHGEFHGTLLGIGGAIATGLTDGQNVFGAEKKPATAGISAKQMQADSRAALPHSKPAGRPAARFARRAGRL